MPKPASLIYGLEDRPPLSTTLLLGLQHICILFIGAIFPVVIVRQLGAEISPHTARSFVSLSMIAGGLATIIQSFKKSKVGSGYLCPAVCGPSYLDASVLAAGIGGLPLLFGMTGFVGAMEVLFSRFMHKLRAVFPTEVTGTVVALVGIVVIPLSVKSFFGIDTYDTVTSPNELIVGISTLVIMVALNVFSKGKLRLFCTIIGMALGYVVAIALGVLDNDAINQISHDKLFFIPYIEKMHWAFDVRLMIPFTIAALASTLKTIGDISTCQRINDDKWVRTDLKSASGGILADGLGGVIPGIIGGFGQSTSSTNVGLSVATGATSRVIAYAVGGLFMGLAFFPKISDVFIAMPKPVMGATLIFSVSFMIIQGLQMMMSRMLDARKIFVVGISLILGLSVDMVPEVYENIHPYLQPVFSSSLSLGAVSAVVLNLLMRIGLKKKAVLLAENTVPDIDQTLNFMTTNGKAWGARPDVINKVTFAMNEILESIHINSLALSPIEFEVTFNELKISLLAKYKGRSPKLDANATKVDIMKTNLETLDLSGFLLAKYADKMKVEEKNGTAVLSLMFDH